MTLLDYVVLVFYVLGTLAVGFYFVRRNRSTSEMFAAGGASPWWVSGLSGFMTLKSAGTFVVWGGMAYREGLVAVTLTTSIGISAILVGLFVAGRWRQIGVKTPAEFIELRFGRAAVQLYTWSMMAVQIVSTGVALYSLSVMLVALAPLEPGNPLRDPATGLLSLPVVVVFFGAVVVTYTIAGGLWAVLMTDVLQFVVLQLAVLFLIPLMALRLADTPELAPLPDQFWQPLSSHYTLPFLVGWIAVHFFRVGAEWPFAQRFICVPSQRDARWSAYLFGALYLINPALWLAPPLMFRLLDSTANPEQAYIMASKAVLPAGMMGLMMAAMFSATASAISGQVNVFAGVLTEQFYRRLINPEASESQAVRAGRLFTFLLGLALVAVALLIPLVGGAQKVILALTGLMFGPLMAPTIWGLLGGRIGLRSVVATAGISFAAGLIVKFGLPDGSWLLQWTADNPRVTDIILGALLPVLILTAAQLLGRSVKPGWARIEARAADYTPTVVDASHADHSPVEVMSLSLSVTGSLMLLLAVVNQEGRMALAGFGCCMLLLALSARRIAARRTA